MVCLSCFHWKAYLHLLFIYHRAPSYGSRIWKDKEADRYAQVRQHMIMIPFPLNVYPTSAVDAGIKWRPAPSEVEELGPEFQEYWESYFANAPDKPVLWMGIGSTCVLKPTMLIIALIISPRFVGNPTLVPPRKYYAMGVYSVSHPLSPYIQRQYA